MARFDSAGTWFDPREAIMREAYKRVAEHTSKRLRAELPTWDDLRMSFNGVTFPVAPIEWKTTRTWEKPKTMNDEKKTKVEISYCDPSWSHPHPSRIAITTPAGHTIDADAAAKAYDEYTSGPKSRLEKELFAALCGR